MTVDRFMEIKRNWSGLATVSNDSYRQVAELVRFIEESDIFKQEDHVSGYADLFMPMLFVLTIYLAGLVSGVVLSLAYLHWIG